MTSRVNPFATRPELVKTLREFGKAAHDGIDTILAELICTRASQINGCAPCLVMHTRNARKHGETEERLYLVSAWRESSLFSERERAALGWTEALTLVSEAGAPDDVYEAFAAHFDEEEQARLTMLIGSINVFNRMNVGFRIPHPVSAPQPTA